MHFSIASSGHPEGGLSHSPLGGSAGKAGEGLHHTGSFQSAARLKMVSRNDADNRSKEKLPPDRQIGLNRGPDLREKS